MSYHTLIFVLLVSFCRPAFSQQGDCNCAAILQLGKTTQIVAQKQLSLLYENQIGIENRLKQVGGSGSVLMKPGLPLSGEFFGTSKKDVYNQYEKLDFEYLDTYMFVNELGDEVANRWLECMKLCNNRAWMAFSNKNEMLLRFGYGDENNYPAKVKSLVTTSGLILTEEIPKEFNGEWSIAIARKPGTNRAEGVKMLLELKSGKLASLEARLPPNLPELVHWRSDQVRTRVPEVREADWKWSIPEIPAGAKAVLYCYYEGGSPATDAAVTLRADARVIDEATGQDIGGGFVWKATRPQTHILASSNSMALPPGKYRTEGKIVTERNGGWLGSSKLQMMVLLEIDPEVFVLDWVKPSE